MSFQIQQIQNQIQNKMPEVRKVEAQQVDEKCPVCGQGYMRPTGIVLTSQPALFEHKCTKCNYKANYTVRYPYFVQ
jgi:transposase-like protein